MNKRKERYYNFIVDDLVKKTEIDKNIGNKKKKREMKFPTVPFFRTPSYYFTSRSSHNFFLLFSKYLKGMYGTHDEEIQIIWDLYKERMTTLINI